MTPAAVVIPVYNEAASVAAVIAAVRRVFFGPLIAVDDGSTDGTDSLLAGIAGLQVVRHEGNLGYGRSLIDGLSAARGLPVNVVVTMDCDGQHEPGHIPEFIEAASSGSADIISGSRYLPNSPVSAAAPPERRRVNEAVTARVNAVTGWGLTDSFCGFKAYRSDALGSLDLHESGYAMPLELWAKSYRAGLRVRELPVERIYFDGDRSFGEDLDDPDKRLGYYLDVWERALQED